MKKILLSTAMLAAMTAIAYAELPAGSGAIGGAVKTSVGTSFANVGTSSEGQVGMNGFGGGAVVVSNSGLQLSLTPTATGVSTAGIYAGAATDGEIAVANDRSVDVSGSMIGKGMVQGEGSTETTFTASILTSADATNNLSLMVPNDTVESTLDQSYQVGGMATLTGEVGSTAAFTLMGSENDFIGQTGTVVEGGFEAVTGFYQASDFADYMDDDSYTPYNGTYTELTIFESEMDLAVENLGGGTVLLSGASSDLFSGGTLATSDSSVDLSVNGVLGAILVCDLFGDAVGNDSLTGCGSGS